MNWFNIALIIILSLGAISDILKIDKPRKPVTHGLAVASVIVAVLLILGIVIYR